MAFNWPWTPRPGRTAPAETKQAGFVALHLAEAARWTRHDYAALAREGYMKNPVVHRAVRLIAEAASGVPWLAFEEGRELSDHPLLALIARPNRMQAGTSFLEALYGHLLMAGNAYVEKIEGPGGTRELHLLRPDRVAVATDTAGWPVALEHREGSARRRGRTRRGGAAPGAVSPARRPLRLRAAQGRADGARYPQPGLALEQGAARQFGKAVRCAGLCAQGRRQPFGRTV